MLGERLKEMGECLAIRLFSAFGGLCREVPNAKDVAILGLCRDRAGHARIGSQIDGVGFQSEMPNFSNKSC